LLFFVLGQIALLVLFWLFEALTKYSVQNDTPSSAAAGIDILGMLISIGIILRYSIAGPFVSMAG
jgi:uncharacterized membrane protein YjfL (UPF0719 family)